MAEALKDFYDRALVTSIAEELRAVHPALDRAAFVRACTRDFEPLSLTQRAARIAEVMHGALPEDYEQAAALLQASLPPLPAPSGGTAMAPFRYLPHVMFVARYGLAHFETSLQLQLELTQRFTAEFSIRAFIEHYPERTHARLLAWTEHPSVHVRRLVSEGTRPRLPWAPRLPAYQRDPEPVIALLERLKDDPELYVRRSVANNLNDIGKDHPERLVELCRRWLVDAPAARVWIVERALRSLVKRGDRGALELLGVGAEPLVALRRVVLSPARPRIGASLELSFSLVSTAAADQQLAVDYAVHYVKANGQPRAKVFKLKRLRLPAGQEVRLGTKIRLTQMTTRTHYPGRHRVDAIINGKVLDLGAFELYG